MLQRRQRIYLPKDYPLTFLIFCFTDNSFYPERNDMLNDLPKRAPSGFLGMRGKKEDEIADIYDKRAPSGSGFLGMRGKKESQNLIADESLFDKRAPSGFLGMRGKKEYLTYDDLDKRVSPNSFFGMRGKKQPGRQSFFGMRGKKYPYEFRSKFIGVRGKKDEVPMDVYGNEIMDNNSGNYGYNTNLDLNELMYILSQGGYGNNDFNFDKRKGPSGFLGMRGK